jgi:actin-related protein
MTETGSSGKTSGPSGQTDPPPVFRFGTPPAVKSGGESSSPEQDATSPDKPAAGASSSGSPFIFGAPKTQDDSNAEAKGSETAGAVPTVVRQNRKFRRSRTDSTPKVAPGAAAPAAATAAAAAPSPESPSVPPTAAADTGGEEPLHYIDEFTNELKGGAPGRPVGAPELFGSPPPQQRERVIRRFKRPTTISSGSPNKDVAGELTAQAVAQAILLKQAGNKLHTEKKFLQASIQYQDALSLLPGAGSQPPGDKDSAAATWVSCQLNMVACQLAQSEWSAAALRSSQILECVAVAPDDVHSRMKAHYRRARARMELGMLDPAWEDLQAAIHLSPNDPALQGLKADLAKKRAVLAAVKPPTPAPIVAGGVSVADAIAAKQVSDKADQNPNGQSPGAQASTIGTDAGLSAENVLKRLTLDSPEQFGQILELAVLRKMQRLGLHEMINIMTTDDMVPGGLPVALADARGELRESVGDEYKAFVFSFMQIEMQLLPGTQLQPTAARVRVNEVVDGLNQLAERLAAGEAFDMSSYDLAVVEGFKTLVRTGPAMTRLHCATSRGSTTEVREMLNSGVECDLEATTESGYTPLVVAILEGQFEVCKMLIGEFGADVNSKGPCGQSLLHYACATVNPDEQLTLVRLLVEGGAAVNARDANGVTCLHLACMGLNKPLTQLFIAHGADLHARSNDGVTPQQAADRWGAPPRGIKSFKSFFQLCVKKSKKDRAALKNQPLPDHDGHHGGRNGSSHGHGNGSSHGGGYGSSSGGSSTSNASLSPPKMQAMSDDADEPCDAAEAADAMAAELIKEEAQTKAEARKKAEKKKKQKQRKQQEKQKKAEEERRVKEEADKLRQEEERAKQAAAQEAQRINREKQQAAQRQRQAALREEQEARARAREAAEKSEAAAKAKAAAKAERAAETAKANKALRAKENRERDLKLQKEKEKEKKGVELSIQEPGFGGRAPLGQRLSQRAAARAVGGFSTTGGKGGASPRQSDEDASSPTCPSTPLAGLSSLPLPPSMTSPPVGLQAATGSSSATSASATSGVARAGVGGGRSSGSGGGGTTAWSPKDLHQESLADAEGPLARLAIVGEAHAAEDEELAMEQAGKDSYVLRGLLHDPTQVDYAGESGSTSGGGGVGGAIETAASGGRVGWGSPGRQVGSPRLDHAIGSMWDADPAPAPAPALSRAAAAVAGGLTGDDKGSTGGHLSSSATWAASVGQMSAGLMPMSGDQDQQSLGGGAGGGGSGGNGSVRPPRNALETAAAWPSVAVGTATGGGGSNNSSSSSSSSSPQSLDVNHLGRGSPPRPGHQQQQQQPGQGQNLGVNSNGQPQVQSWATGRLVGSPSSPGSPDGRDLGEEELPDWLLSTLGEMGGDGIIATTDKDAEQQPTSPVAQYLSQETPAGPRRSDLKLAGRRGPSSPPHPVLASLGQSLAGNGVGVAMEPGGGGGVSVAPPMMMGSGTQQAGGTAVGGGGGGGGGSVPAPGRLSPVQWAPSDTFPPPPAVAGAGSLPGNVGWGMGDASNSQNPGGGRSNGRGRGESNKGWTVGPHRANIV